MDIWEQEYERWRAWRDRRNASERKRRADPANRERYNCYHREYQRRRRATDPEYRERDNRNHRESQRARRAASCTNSRVPTTHAPAPK